MWFTTRAASRWHGPPRPHDRASAELGAIDGRAAGYACEVREPLPEYPGPWSVVCERHDAMIDLPVVIGG